MTNIKNSIFIIFIRARQIGKRLSGCHVPKLFLLRRVETKFSTLKFSTSSSTNLPTEKRKIFCSNIQAYSCLPVKFLQLVSSFYYQAPISRAYGIRRLFYSFLILTLTSAKYFRILYNIIEHSIYKHRLAVSDT